MDPRAVPGCSSDIEVRVAGTSPVSLVSFINFIIFYSKLLDATALRLALFINYILVVIGEINGFCYSSLVKRTYLTIRLSMEKFGSGIKL